MTRDERDRLAAEYALGLLEGSEAAAAEDAVRTDRAFEDSVARWRERFAELDAQAPALAPDETLWRRIESDLSAAPAARTAAPPRRAGVVGSLLQSLAFWRAAGLAGSFASILLALGLVTVLWRAPQKPTFVAVLVTDDNRPAAILNAYADGEAELVPLAGTSIPAGRSLELWTFAGGTSAPPVSVRVLDQARAVRFRLDRLPRLAPEQLFAVSLEPHGGSPTGQPTGPVLMKGTATSAL